jgi:signal peptidase I
MRLLRPILIGAVSVTTVALAAFAAALVTMRILGYSAAVVMGGSMTPAIPMGSLIVIEPTAPSAVSVGDVITFTLPDRLITHRVFAIERDDSGVRLMTKGDANDAPDPIAVRAGSAVGAVRLALPLVGYLLFELQGWWRPIALAIVLAVALDTARRRRARGRRDRAHRSASAAA